MPVCEKKLFQKNIIELMEAQDCFFKQKTGQEVEEENSTHPSSNKRRVSFDETGDVEDRAIEIMRSPTVHHRRARSRLNEIVTNFSSESSVELILEEPSHNDDDDSPHSIGLFSFKNNEDETKEERRESHIAGSTAMKRVF